ncbi:MAG TPA: hypothetical protein VII06_09595 [Chloroflexota bacterium]|jgi:hypothetical protein
MGEVRWGCRVRVEDYGPVDLALARSGRLRPVRVQEARGNKPLFLGLATVWERIIGNAAGQPFDEAHAQLGVGDGADVTEQAQHALTGANTAWAGMETGYPIHSDGPRIDAADVIFRAAFGSGTAAFEWQEIGVANEPNGAGVLLNRLATSFGVKNIDDVWIVAMTLTLYGTADAESEEVIGEEPITPPDLGQLLPAGWDILTIPLAFGVTGVPLTAGFVADLPLRSACELRAAQLVAVSGAGSDGSCDLEVAVYLTPSAAYPGFTYPVGTLSIAGGTQATADLTAARVYPGDVLRFVVGGSPSAETATVALEAQRTSDWAQVFGDDGDAPTVVSVETRVGTSPSGMILTLVVTASERVEGRVRYGTTTSYGQSADLEPVMESLVGAELVGLASGTTYHYVIDLVDAAGHRTTTADATITTP